MKPTTDIDPSNDADTARRSVSINIVKTNPDAILPVYASTSASGADVHACIMESMVLLPGHRVLVSTGIAVSIPHGYEIQARPRSGLAYKHGIFLLNSPGTIDADYRGEIKVILANFSDTPFTIEPGMRIAQLVLAPVYFMDFRMVDVLDATMRDAGGFGSTGH